MDQPSEKIYQVSELNHEVRSLLRHHYSNIKLIGEVSGVTRSYAGHFYLNLKDSQSEIDCALFRRDAENAPPLIDGAQIVAEGSVSLYVQRGNYQFVLRNFKPAGEGDLFLAFEKLKKKLESEGLFAADRKKPLPTPPKSVGIITSATGAVVQDIIKTFRRRSPSIELVLYPVSVQGENAPPEIVSAVQTANRRQEVEAIILGRGGGSIEDLWAFNDERVARAIAGSEIPIVSSVGHETDFTIADFVADQRAATPTAAAEILSTPSDRDRAAQFADLINQLHRSITRKLNDRGQHVDLAARGLVHPSTSIKNLKDKFQHQSELTNLQMESILKRKYENCKILEQKLLSVAPTQKYAYYRQEIAYNRSLLDRCFQEQLKSMTSATQALRTRIESLNPQATLKRGYAIVRDKQNQSIIRDAKTVDTGQKVTAQLGAGMLHLEVEKTEI